jgi:hypothetical protein
MAAAEEVVAWMALLFEGGVSNETTQAIFRKLDDAKKVQVCSMRCYYCAPSALLSSHSLSRVYRCT